MLRAHVFRHNGDLSSQEHCSSPLVILTEIWLPFHEAKRFSFNLYYRKHKIQLQQQNLKILVSNVIFNLVKLSSCNV